MLLSMSRVHRIPTPAVSLDIIEGCRKEFLCGESACCKRYYCSLSDVDKLLAERIIPD